jgi:nucleoside-diphosphate-sugar epimerase
MMKIVVIGGSGFIGTRLVSQLLQRGHEVAIYDIAASTAYPERVVFGDVRDTAALTRALAGADCAVNLAAQHRDDVRPESLYFDVNVNGAESLVIAAERNSLRRIFFVSSAAVYGFNQPNADESAPLAPANAYGKSKAEAESVYRRWCVSDALRALVIVRPTVVFGEGNRGNVYHLIEQIRRGRFLMIGNGNNRKSIAYVGNLVEFLCAWLDARPGVHLYNYADKPDKSVRELVATIGALTDRRTASGFALPYWLAWSIGCLCDCIAAIRRKPLLISRVRVRKFCADTQIDTAALERTGFKPSHTIDEGLTKMVASMPRERD